jgi:hypothetical protein
MVSPTKVGWGGELQLSTSKKCAGIYNYTVAVGTSARSSRALAAKHSLSCSRNTPPPLHLWNPKVNARVHKSRRLTLSQYSFWLRSGRSGFDPRQEQRIFLLASASHPASVQWVPGVLSQGVKRGRGVTLTTHPHLLPRLSMSRSKTSSPSPPPMCPHGV